MQVVDYSKDFENLPSIKLLSMRDLAAADVNRKSQEYKDSLMHWQAIESELEIRKVQSEVLLSEGRNIDREEALMISFDRAIKATEGGLTRHLRVGTEKLLEAAHERRDEFKTTP